MNVTAAQTFARSTLYEPFVGRLEQNLNVADELKRLSKVEAILLEACKLVKFEIYNDARLQENC